VESPIITSEKKLKLVMIGQATSNFKLMKLLRGIKACVNSYPVLVVIIASLWSLEFVNKNAYAQIALPEIVPGEIVNSIKNTTLTRSKSSGGKSSLSFGSSTSFGTNASVNSTPGAKVESISTMGFDSATLTTRIGGDTDSVTADIGNIRANNLSQDVDRDIVSESNSYSNGNADITGVFQENIFDLTPSNVETGTPTSISTKASTVHGDSAIYEEISTPNTLESNQTASASSGATISTKTDVDINTTEFINSFQQAY